MGEGRKHEVRLAEPGFGVDDYAARRRQHLAHEEVRVGQVAFKPFANQKRDIGKIYQARLWRFAVVMRVGDRRRLVGYGATIDLRLIAGFQGGRDDALFGVVIEPDRAANVVERVGGCQVCSGRAVRIDRRVDLHDAPEVDGAPLEQVGLMPWVRTEDNATGGGDLLCYSVGNLALELVRHGALSSTASRSNAPPSGPDALPQEARLGARLMVSRGTAYCKAMLS